MTTPYWLTCPSYPSHGLSLEKEGREQIYLLGQRCSSAPSLCVIWPTTQAGWGGLRRAGLPASRRPSRDVAKVPVRLGGGRRRRLLRAAARGNCAAAAASRWFPPARGAGGGKAGGRGPRTANAAFRGARPEPGAGRNRECGPLGPGRAAGRLGERPAGWGEGSRGAEAGSPLRAFSDGLREGAGEGVSFFAWRFWKDKPLS